jgi:hypothetical protein
MASATTARPWGFGAGDADDKQRVEAFADGIRTVHVIKPEGTCHPEKFGMRDIQRPPIRKINGEWDKGLATETPPDFTDHGEEEIPVSGASAAFAFPAGSLLHTDDCRGIEIFGGVQFFIEKQQHITRPRAYGFGFRDEQFPPAVESNDEGLERHFRLPGFYFLQHAWTFRTLPEVRKAYF